MGKTLLLPFLLSPVLFVSAQTNAETDAPVTTAQTYAYVNGVRLDSIDAQYAEYDLRTHGHITFDYGQQEKRRRETTLRNRAGAALSFNYPSTPFLLNFFYFNGWELYQVYPNGSNFIFKKKDR